MALNNRNDCPNPYAATATAGATISTSNATLSRVTGLSGSWTKSTAFRATKTTSAGDMILILPLTADQGNIAGNIWSCTVQWAVSTNISTFYVMLGGHDAAGTYLSNASFSQPTVTANGIVTTVVKGSMPTNSRRVAISLYAVNATSGTTITATACRCDSVDDASLIYADGSTPGWFWEGTSGQSTSIQPIVKTGLDSGTSIESPSSTWNNTQPARYGSAWDWEPNHTITVSNPTYSNDSGPDGEISVSDNTTSGTRSSVAIQNGRAEIVWGTGLTTTSQAVYLDQPTPYVIKYMTATFGFGTGADAAGASICMASWTNPHATQSVQAQIHLSISRSTWIYYIVDTTSNIVALKQANFATALVADWRRYTATVSISGNTASLVLPDGTTDTVTDSRIGSFQGTTQCFEFFRNNTTYTAPIALYRAYAGPTSFNPLANDSFVFNDNSLLDTAGGAKLGTDSWLMTETSAVFARPSTSDTATSAEACTGATSATSNELSALTDLSNLVAASISSDISTLNESNSIFQGLLKDTTELGSFSELVTLFVTQSRTDTASGNDTQQEASSFYKADLYTIFDNVIQQNLLSSDFLTFTETIPPRFDYVITQDIFTLLDLGFSNRPLDDTDLFEFVEQANVSERQLVTNDPFTYPDKYYGGTLTRIIAQDHFTREFIHWDLPVDNLELTFSLSGPNLLLAKLSTEMGSLINLNPPLTPDRTWLHVEDDGEIIASFIMTPSIDNPQDQTRQIEGEGFSGYPHWIYYEDDQYIGVQVDPADVIRKIWDHVQDFPDGNLNVKIWPTITPVRIGYPNTSIQFTTKEGNEVNIQGSPVNLNFWSALNCGEEINRICQENSIEFWEYSQWNENKSDVEHYIVLGYPRVGAKRNDLVFREGENMVQLIPSYQETQENYASDVFVIGAGTGPGAVRAKSSGRIGRLRKTNVIQDQTISNKDRAQKIADFEFNRISKSRFLIENITIDTTHTNARWGTFIAGDDIYVEGTIPYVGKVQNWYRIVNYTYNVYSRAAQLNLQPSDSFSYGATVVNPFADLPREGYAVLTNSDVEIRDASDPDAVKEAGIRIAQQQGVELFNKNNIRDGTAYAYRSINDTSVYEMQIIAITDVFEPWFLILGRTSDGYLLTGENIYLVATNGTVGQKPETQNENANSTEAPKSSIAPPFPNGMKLAAREFQNAFAANFRFDEALNFMGMSSNGKTWQTDIYNHWRANGGSYNYNIGAPSGLPQTLDLIFHDAVTLPGGG